MFWMILLGLLLAFLLWVLFAPIYVQVEWTENQQRACLQWWGLFQVSIVYEQEGWIFRLELPWFSKTWPLRTLWPAKKNVDRPGRKVSKGKTWKPKRPWLLLRRVWHSFHLIRFRYALDTDDYVWNAYLFPLFQATNPANKAAWQINFQGRNELLLIVENRLYRLLYAFIRTVV